MFRSFLSFITLCLLTACASLGSKSGTICVEEIGMSNCLISNEYTDYEKPDRFKLTGTIYSFTDSLPALNASVLFRGVNEQIFINNQGEFSIEIDHEAETMLIIDKVGSYYERKVQPQLGKRGERIEGCDNSIREYIN